MFSVNELYCGDNLEILREYIAPESVDLVYLDPPFNSDQNYNLLFREKDGSKSNSQILAFEDTWEWNKESEKTYDEITEKGGKLGEVMTLFRALFEKSDLLAYLSMMAPRLEELRRVLKSSGALYLHCDPTASHYLKMLLDAIFGPANFQNEIIWKRTTTKNDYTQGATNWPRIHDILLCYSKDASQARFKQPFAPLDEGYIRSHYHLKDQSGRHYQLDNLTAPGAGSRGHPKYEFMGVTKFWRYNKEKMERLLSEGRIVQPRPGAVPRYKRYLDETKGVAIGDMWWDIPPVNSQAAERIGYPTQKPQALLERIIVASSEEGDTILDPFCGCGTAVEAAHAKNRKWIGIDLTKIAIDVVKDRLLKIGEKSGKTYQTIWEPRDLSSAKALADDDPFQFQDWIVKKLGGISTKHRGADRGIDGRVYFKDHPTGPLKQIIVSVKSGKITPAFVRELHGTVNREKAAMGILATLATPSKAMERDATTCGFHKGLSGTYPRMQIITAEQIFAGT
jgi:adenine specific DNA methylase Mod